MITIEEAKKRFAKGEFVAGMEPISDFIISARIDNGSEKNVFVINEMNNMLNKNLQLREYSNGIVNHLTIIFILLPKYGGTDVNWKERKFFKRNKKNYFLICK